MNVAGAPFVPSFSPLYAELSPPPTSATETLIEQAERLAQERLQKLTGTAVEAPFPLGVKPPPTTEEAGASRDTPATSTRLHCVVIQSATSADTHSPQPQLPCPPPEL